MKLPDSAHTSLPWRIHEIAPELKVEDVWALPTPGGPGDFPRLLESVGKADFPGDEAPFAVRAVWEARWKIGKLLGWDRPGKSLGRRVPSLRDRLPDEMRDGPKGPEMEGLPFTPLYLLENEWAAEMANQTVFGVLHIGWVEDESGGYRGQMAALVKPNGVFGSLYMAGIKPFRRFLVYPALMRHMEKSWKATV